MYFIIFSTKMVTVEGIKCLYKERKFVKCTFPTKSFNDLKRMVFYKKDLTDNDRVIIFDN